MPIDNVGQFFSDDLPVTAVRDAAGRPVREDVTDGYFRWSRSWSWQSNGQPVLSKWVRQSIDRRRVPVMSEVNGLTGGIKVSAGTDSPSDIVPAARFWLPWFRGAGGSAFDKTYQGDAAKQGLGSATQTRGYFTSKDGTFGVSGTGLYYEIDAVRGNFELDTHSAVFHCTINMAAPGSTKYPVSTQFNSSSPGILIAATAAGELKPYLRIGSGGTQNAMNNIPGMCDGTDHDITLVFDRGERKCYVFADGVLFETKVLAGTGTTDSGAALRFGGYAGAGTCDAKFANAHMYVFAADAADLDVNAIVDKLVLQRQPLLRSDV